MAVSSIKGCWFKFSARLKELRDSLDAEGHYNNHDRSHHGADSTSSRSTIQQIARAYEKSAKDRRSANGGGVVVGGKSSHRNNNDLHSTSNKYGQSVRQLPAGFNKKKTSQGQVYFVDTNGHKYWYDPSVPKELLNAALDLDSLIGRLSTNWETRQTSSGKTYYVNHIKKTTQFTDPRLIAYKDHLMSILKHAQNQQTNNNNNLSGSGPLSTSSSRHLNNPISPNNTATCNQHAFSHRNCSACQNGSHVPNPTANHSNNLSRQFGTGTLDLHRGQNNTNHRYQQNLLSGSHHNLSTMTNQSNTLTGPPPAWFQLGGSINVAPGRKQTSSGLQNTTLPPSSNVCSHDVSSTSNVQRSSQQTDFSSGSISNLFPISGNTVNTSTTITSSANHNVSPHPDKQSTIPIHPRSNKELFDKISILRQELLKQQVIAHPCRIDISRKRIFEESFRVVSHMQARDLKKRLLVKFKGEEGLDYGGVAREWFYLLSREILNPVHGLFQYTSDDIYNLQINPDSGIVYREHLSYFNFCGRVIGMAVFHGHFIEGHFTLPFYKMLLRKSITLGDIELVDPELYRSLCWILDNDITNVIDTTFLVQHNAFGQLQEHELKENGRNIVVTENNKHEYVDLYVNYRCRRGIASQFEALQRGFNELISPSLVENFDEHELELLIGGLSKINIEDWRLHTKLKNCTVDTPLVRWFWDIVKSYSEDKRARLLQFVTGSPRVPIQGFKALQGVNSELRLFTIHLIKNAFTDNLPKSHTCFNRIDLPPYESYEKLRDKLTQAIEETMGFAMQ